MPPRFSFGKTFDRSQQDARPYLFRDDGIPEGGALHDAVVRPWQDTTTLLADVPTSPAGVGERRQGVADDFLAQIRARMGGAHAAAAPDGPAADAPEITFSRAEAMKPRIGPANPSPGVYEPTDAEIDRASRRNDERKKLERGFAAKNVGVFEDQNNPGQVYLRYRGEDGKEFVIPKTFATDPATRSYAAKEIAGKGSLVTPEEASAARARPRGFLQYEGQVNDVPAPGVIRYGGPSGRTQSGEPRSFLAFKNEAPGMTQDLRERGYGVLPGPSQTELDNVDRRNARIAADDDRQRLELAAAANAFQQSATAASDRVRSFREEAAKRKPSYAALAAAPGAPPTRR